MFPKQFTQIFILTCMMNMLENTHKYYVNINTKNVTL